MCVAVKLCYYFWFSSFNGTSQIQLKVHWIFILYSVVKKIKKGDSYQLDQRVWYDQQNLVFPNRRLFCHLLNSSWRHDCYIKDKDFIINQSSSDFSMTTVMKRVKMFLDLMDPYMRGRKLLVTILLLNYKKFDLTYLVACLIVLVSSKSKSGTLDLDVVACIFVNGNVNSVIIRFILFRKMNCKLYNCRHDIYYCLQFLLKFASKLILQGIIRTAL